MPTSTLILACGALARELVELQRLNQWQHIQLKCLPAELHNRPDKIPTSVRAELVALHDQFDKIFVAYADCGTGGLLDKLLAEFDIERLPGAHCYEFFTGTENFTQLVDEELGTFYLTDFLVRNFDRLIIKGLGLDKHPHLHADYFGHYRRLVYLAQTESLELEAKAQACAKRLDLEYVYHWTGLDHVANEIQKTTGTTASVTIKHNNLNNNTIINR